MKLWKLAVSILMLSPVFAPVAISRPLKGSVELEMQKHVSFAHQPAANETLAQAAIRIPAPGNCAEYAAVGWLAGRFGDAVAATYILTTPQNQLIQKADEFACRGDAVNGQLAVRFLQVVQCHNSQVVDFVEHNQTEAKYILRRHGGCEALD